MRALRSVLAVTAALAASGSLLTGSSHAGPAGAPPPGDYYVQSAVTGLNAADENGAVEQHRPRGDEDRQQWSLRAAGSGGGTYVLENTDQAGLCLGRAGDRARTADCSSADAAWEVTAADGGTYTLRVPGGDRHLSLAEKPSGADYPAELVIGSGGSLAAWYLTPADAPTAPMPPEDQRTLDQVTFLTSHNAYANGVDGGFAPPFVNLLPNQSRGIEQQLTDGVRGFMMDIHQTPDGAILCHNSCTLVNKPVSLSTDLQRMVDFLRRTPDAFVTVFLEDYVAPGVLRDSLGQVSGLNELLYRPDREGVRENGWPRMAELLEKNQRLLLFTDHSRSADEAAGLARDSFGVMYQQEWTVENYWSMGSGAGSSDWSCYSRWYGGDTNVPLTRTEPGFRPLFVMNHFRDATIEATARTDNTKLLDRAQRFCQPAARKKPGYVAVDRYELGGTDAAVSTMNGYIDRY